MVELAELRRDSRFGFLKQVLRELEDRAVPGVGILLEMAEFELAWNTGDDPRTLAQHFRFRKVHHAESARRGILLYEIYVQNARYRAVIAWFDSEGPGVWVSVFKKQGDSQSKASLRTAGDRAVNYWRQEYE